MKQFPSRLKFRKNHKSSYSNMKIYDHKNFFPMNGDFSLRAIKAGKINFKQIEACRKSIRRSLKKTGIVTVRVFTGFSETKKALGSRMGKGKGSHSIWICPIRKGQIIFELANVPQFLAEHALKSASSKLPLVTKISKNLY